MKPQEKNLTTKLMKRHKGKKERYLKILCASPMRNMKRL